jgi:diguanylate cyclase (GGDEF)-like protein
MRAMSMLRRLILAFAIVIVIGTAQGMLLLGNLETLGAKTTFLATKSIVSVDRARAAWSSYRDSRLFLSRALEMTTIQDAKSVLADFAEHADKLDEHLRHLAAATSSLDAAETLKVVKEDVSLWETKARILLDSSPSTGIPAPHILAQIDARVRKGLERLDSLALADAAAVSADAKSAVETSTKLGIALIITSMVAGLGLAVLSSLAITRPLTRLDRTMRTLAAGDLTAEVTEKERRDEIGRMAAALEIFRANTIEMRRLDTANAIVDRKMREQSVQLNTAVNNMRQGLLMFDANGRLIVSNRQYAEMYRLPPEAVVPGITVHRLLELRVQAGTFAGDAEKFVRDTLENNTQVPKATKLPDGRTIALAVEYMEGGGWVATHEDITEGKIAEAKIEYMAHHDALTGLSNRTAFRARMEEAIARSRRGVQFAVHCLDLDRFKIVNDTLGHAVGDDLLQAVSRRLTGCLRDIDSLARLGGDEFVILQEGVERQDDAAALASRIIEAIGRPYDLNGHQVVIGVSVGIATAPLDGRDFEKLMRHADMALYRAKGDGRATYCFFEVQMNDDQRTRQNLESDLRMALKRGELQAYYQPIVDVETRSIASCEALLRWHHPRGGMISPVIFIPIAEEIGLIDSIGEWVLREACKEAVSWPTHIRVAVNLSPVQFRNQDLFAKILRALAYSGLPADRLELEITESVLLLENAATMAVLHDLRDLGIRISMDDFGTGYSSLGYLRSFPFDKIKIDRSFVNELSIDQDCSTIIKAVADIGRGLGIDTIAEGVETLAQFDQVKAKGCTQVQGFLFGAPCPSTEIRRLIAGDQASSDAA